MRTIECELIINPQMLNNMYRFPGDQLEKFDQGEKSTWNQSALAIDRIQRRRLFYDP
jgi:hypothetical protein